MKPDELLRLFGWVIREVTEIIPLMRPVDDGRAKSKEDVTKEFDKVDDETVEQIGRNLNKLVQLIRPGYFVSLQRCITYGPVPAEYTKRVWLTITNYKTPEMLKLE